MSTQAELKEIVSVIQEELNREAEKHESKRADCFIYEEFVERISEILEKHGFQRWDATDILGEGSDWKWGYGQTLTYDKNDIYIEIVTNIEGSGDTVLTVSARVFRIYSYEYDEEDNAIIHFAYEVKFKDNKIELIDCSDDLSDEL